MTDTGSKIHPEHLSQISEAIINYERIVASNMADDKLLADSRSELKRLKEIMDIQIELYGGATSLNEAINKWGEQTREAHKRVIGES